MFGMSMDIGIDLGTANVLVYVKGKGIVLKEPSVVAVNRDTNQVLAIGEEARQMIGRTPGNIVAIRPLRDGVIADYDITESMLRFFIEKVVGRSIVAGLDIVEAQGSMVVDIGGGTTDVAVISLGGVVTSESIRVAGDTFDEDLIGYVKREFNLLIGERTAEEIKLRVGAAHTAARREQMDVRGRDLLSGLPKNITISTAQASSAIEGSVMRIVDCVKKVLEETPPELAADIMDRGIVLTGGGALLYGMPELIQRETGTPTVVADDPMSCVALGCGKALDIFDKFDGKALNASFGRKK